MAARRDQAGSPIRVTLGAVAALVVAASLAVVAVSATGEQAVPAPTPAVQVQDGAYGPVESSTERLGCTDADEQANFRYFSLGPTFEELPLTAVIRRCDTPYPGEPARANFISFIYGTCDVPTDPATGYADGGCAPPLEVQSWPACERARADYEIEDGTPYPRDDLEARGVPAGSFDDGTRLELYTGSSTVVVFGADPKLVAQAAESLRPEPPSQPPAAPVKSESDPPADLAPPTADALAGKLACA